MVWELTREQEGMLLRASGFALYFAVGLVITSIQARHQNLRWHRPGHLALLGVYVLLWPLVFACWQLEQLFETLGELEDNVRSWGQPLGSTGNQTPDALGPNNENSDLQKSSCKAQEDLRRFQQHP